ncbi:DUF481 domain-containing protein [Pelagicoccus sp. NFK12]|uniref:DUF481 domain-containing protein n=1 Tax=Pelagicoccus enzymogenes TaxID=2773457 RepID=A0A927F516_9BACT|nr:DUF481 domain-containing protein [Pelagicoccus enzymogenes]MBD5778524.1 DUF481 domain-containing protein [Pelagicoccus enzymogenes]MDQ8197114.1 DUF481 domain-containing protein [Pelagicoccus enzymogenes]
MSKFFLTVFLSLLAAALSRADSREVQVVLDNGDSLSGNLLSESDEEIRLSVDYLGEISLPRSRVAEVVGKGKAEEEAEEQAEEAIAETKIAPVPEKPRVVKDVPAPPKAVAAASEEEEEPEQKRSVVDRFFAALGNLEGDLGILPEWDKSLQIGLNSSSGRKDQSTQNYRLDMDRKFESSRIKIKAEYAYGEANGSKTRDRLSSNYRWRKDIGPGVFYESESDYYSDEIKLIDSNLEQKIGLGTRFLDQKDSTLSAGLGASGRWRTFPEKEAEVDYLVSVFQDWDYRMSEKIRVRQDFNFAMPLEDTDGYEINFSTAVTSAVSKSVKLSLRYELGFDNSLAEDRREDRRFISSLGYAF